MKLNIFSIPPGNVPALEEKFESVGLKAVYQGEQAGWTARFYFSQDEVPSSISWAETFAEFFDKQPLNLIYFGAYVFRKEDHCFALTYGKSHFYVRSLCDHDFGIEMAKRIATEGDIKQTASKKFAGNKKKEIKSYTNNTPLNIESGESVDYLRAAIEADAKATFGATGKFGSSILLNAPITKADIGVLLDKIVTSLGEEAKFKLPRTTVIKDDEEVRRYDDKLLTAIVSDEGSAEFAYATHDIVGVDFVFSGNERYTLSCRGHRQRKLGDEDLDLLALRAYITSERIKRDEILNIQVRIDNEGQKSYSKRLHEALDFIVEGEKVMLSHGRWVGFNEDYVDQLDESLDSITIEKTEPHFQVIHSEEGVFNKSEVVKGLGYVDADKDFSKIKTEKMPATQIEAWDLHKEGSVYAVKFGNAQTLGYACDQANNVLEIIRNNANTKKLKQEFKVYCLWFGFKLKHIPSRISDTKSIILKQKIDAWARRCRDLGIEPRLKLSLRASNSET